MYILSLPSLIYVLYTQRSLYGTQLTTPYILSPVILSLYPNTLKVFIHYHTYQHLLPHPLRWLLLPAADSKCL